MIKIIEILSTEYSATSPTPIRAHLIADTTSDLPAPTGITGYQLTIGSICDVIHDSTRYTMQSDGTWVQTLKDITADVYTKQQVDAMIDAIELAEADLRDKIEGTQAALADLINAGAKNICNPVDAVGYNYQGQFPATIGGVTYTLNADGSITCSGTSSAIRVFKIPVTLVSGVTYVISGCPAGGADSSYRLDIRLQGTSTVKAVDYGDSASFTATQAAYDLCIRYPSTNPNPIQEATFHIMLTTKNLYDITDTYVQYAPTNKQLYDMIQNA